MATDVVPVLNERIQTSFQGNMMKDRRVLQISNRIRDGTATFKDGHDYAERLGENLSKSLVKNLNESTLPDGRLYYNIANRTVVRRFKQITILRMKQPNRFRALLISLLESALKVLELIFRKVGFMTLSIK